VHRHWSEINDGPFHSHEGVAKPSLRCGSEKERHHIPSVVLEANMGVPHQRPYHHHLEGDRVHRVSFDDTSSTQPWPQGDLVAAHVDSVPERAADPSSRDNRAVKRYGDRPDISQSKLAMVASSSAAIASAIVDFPAEVEPLTSKSRVVQE
jgi:hypothetical protein